MSESIRRKNSSRQLLQNLIRVTAQRSLEDAEEAERERRRRARDKQRGEGTEPPPQNNNNNNLTPTTDPERELKPSCCLVLDEDEGFSDWSQRLENRGEQEECRAAPELMSSGRQRRPDAREEQKREVDEEEEEQEEEEQWEPELSRPSRGSSDAPPDKASCSRRRKETRPSFSSTVFLSQDSRQQHAAGQPAERTSYLAAGTMRPRQVTPDSRGPDSRGSDAGPLTHQIPTPAQSGGLCQVDQRGEGLQLRARRNLCSASATSAAATSAEAVASSGHTLTDEEDQQEEEVLSYTQEEEEEEEEEGQRTPLKAQRSVEECERRSEAAGRRSRASVCSSDGEEALGGYGPMSPTFKKLLIQFYPDEANTRVDTKCTITERTESLRKSTGSTKKTSPPLPVSKIDKRLQQYTHALEVSAKDNRSGGQMMGDLAASKDADGLKVGVSDLISQWVKGGDEGSGGGGGGGGGSPSKPVEIKPGDVLNKKNLWESLNDTLSPGKEGKESSHGKRYRFVVTGHGKYEKVSADDSCMEDFNWSDGQVPEDL